MEENKDQTTKPESPRRLFEGKFPCQLDAKNRLTIPRKLRPLVPVDAEGVRRLVICKAKDRCLDLYPLDYFAGIVERLRALPPGPEKRKLIRFYSVESEELRIDRFGRVQMPPDFLEELGREKDFVVVGAFEYMEIWKRDEFKARRDEAIEGFYGSTFEP